MADIINKAPTIDIYRLYIYQIWSFSISIALPSNGH